VTLTSKTLAALVAAILFGGIFFSSAMGWWQTESAKEAAKITSGEYAGQANPADIRGSYTLGDVDKNFGIAPALLAEAFGIKDSNPAAFQVKGLEGMYANSGQEVGTASVRLFVALYKGMPYNLSADIYLPESAVTLLRARNLTGEQVAYLAKHTVPNLGAAPASAPSAPQTTPQPQATQVPAAQSMPQATKAPSAQSTPKSETPGASSTDRAVKGVTTFADVLGWGVPKATIEQVLGVPMPAAPGMKVKDYCTEKGLNFETVRLALQAEVDKVK
jgi:hypothetical protein